jgi:hypothetical protein
VYIDKICKHVNISIAQKNNIQVLEEIKRFFGYGKVENYSFIIYKKENIQHFIQLMKPQCIVKYNQLCAMETFLQTSVMEVKEEMYRLCNEEKHQVEQFDELNQSDQGKQGYLQKVAQMERHRLAFQEIRKRKQYMEKSENMMGENNHNYGKAKSEEVRKKMSITHKLNHGIPDHVILRVRELIDQGHKNVDIETMLKVGRHVVSRIKNGELVCMNEDKKDNHKMTVEEQAISKRKIRIDEIWLIIDKCIEGWKPGAIFHLLKENRGKQNESSENITIDIVKNMKRNLTIKKCPLYHFEERYAEYVEKINKSEII